MMSLTKIGGLGGILGVIVAVITIGLFGTGAGRNPSGSDVVSWAASNPTAIDATLVLTAVGLFLFGFFVVALYALLRDREVPNERWTVVGLAGGITSGALSGMQNVLLVPLAAEPEAVGEEAAGVLYLVFNAVNSPLALTAAFMLVGFAVAIQRTGALPTWTAYVAWVSAVLMVIGGLAVMPTATTTGLSLATLIGFLVFLAWTLIVGVLMLRADGTERAPRTANPA